MNYTVEYSGLLSDQTITVSAESADEAREVAVQKIVDRSGILERGTGQIVCKWTPERAAARIISVTEKR